MRYVLTADQEDLEGTESASLSTAVMLSHVLAVDQGSGGLTQRLFEGRGSDVTHPRHHM